MKTTTAPTTRHATLRLLAALFFLCLFAPVAMGEGDSYWQDQPSEVADKLVNKDSGKGGENDPILIASRAEFIYFAKQVNSREPIDLENGGGQIKHDDKGKDSFGGYYFALTDNIDLSEYYWTPIGNIDHPFYGNFDGGGHRVSGLKVKVEAEIEVYVGLFGKTSSGTIQNLGVCLAEEGIQVTTKTNSGLAYAGGIAGQALSIRNCYVEGPKTGTAKVIAIAPQKGVCFAGGIVGSLLASSSITHCYATVDVTAEGDNESYAGGIAGQSQSSISYTYATGAVEATNGDNCAGGICGFAPITSSLSNNLALNKSIKGDKGKSNRILGDGPAPLTSNFASPEIPVNGSRVSPDQDGLNGTDTWLDTFEEDLKDAFSVNNEWNATDTWTWISGYLPQLNVFGNNQPQIKASSVLTRLEDLSLNLEETSGNVYISCVDGKWLYNMKGSENSTIPFNGTVTGIGQSPITITSVILDPALPNLDPTPTLTFKDMFLTTDGTCLTVEDGVTLPLHLEGKNGLINKGQSGYAIDNKGTLTLTGELLCLSGPASSTIDGNGTITYDSPMMEWQFENPLQAKSFAWETASGQPLIECVNEGTTSRVALVVADATKQVRLKVGPSDKTSSPVTQQYHDGNHYTTSFTPQPGQRTVFADVKPICFRIHLIQPAGGDLTVTYKDGSPLPNDNYVATGTQLTLLCTPEDNYILESYQSGPAADNLPDLQGNEVTVGESDLWLSARLRYERPTPPPPPAPVYYTVTLPQIEGATTDPGPGEYEVESWDSFRFYLTIDSAYSESQPIVTTDRGETLVPRTSDGAYLVKYVRTDVEIFIDGLIKNPPPVANEAISTDALVPQIWAEGSMLCIRMAEALPSAPVRIFTPDGRLHASFASTPGLNRRQLPTGIYIVRIGETACKVIIR